MFKAIYLCQQSEIEKIGFSDITRNPGYKVSMRESNNNFQDI